MKKLSKHIPYGLKNKKGVALIIVAGVLIALFALAALAIDIAYMYLVKNELQVAADAAALAGAALLTGEVDNNPNALLQASARQEAWRFACRNKAAGQNVYLVTNTPDDCSPPSGTSLNGSNSANGDIVVGNWNETTRVFTPATGGTNLAINAIKARPRRADEGSGYNMGPVSIFLGRVFGWNVMSASAEAIAVRKPLAMPGLAFCIRSCDLTTPTNLLIHEGGGPTCSSPTCLDRTNRMAFTAFNDKQAPNVGQNGDVVEYIWGRKTLPDRICDSCVTTNNTAGGGAALGELKNAFQDKNYKRADKTFDSQGNVTSWRVAAPLVDRQCDQSSDPCSGCPPGCQGKAEPYHIERIAEIIITAVIDSGPTTDRGIRISSIVCRSCPTFIPLSREVGLVK